MPEPLPTMARETRQERTETARLDNFVDGAFAFAITLLVISGARLPRDVAALEHALRGIPAFAACFGQLALFWHGHVRWRDTARLADRTSLWLSLLLVFFALIFVFPLHLVYANFFSGMTGGVLSPDFAMHGASVSALSALFACYGLSYACMAGTLAFLFQHAAHHAVLSPATTVDARVSTAVWSYCAAIGLFSTLIALLALAAGILWLIAVAGFSYGLLGFTHKVANHFRIRVERRLPA